MAEWLGQHMANWPTWAIGAGIIVIVVCGLIYYFTDATIMTNTEPYWRKKRGKK